MKTVVFLPNMLNRDIDLRLDRFHHVPGLLLRSIVSHDDFKITIRLSGESSQPLIQPLGMVVGRKYYRGKHQSSLLQINFRLVHCFCISKLYDAIRDSIQGVAKFSRGGQ